MQMGTAMREIGKMGSKMEGASILVLKIFKFWDLGMAVKIVAAA